MKNTDVGRAWKSGSKALSLALLVACSNRGWAQNWFLYTPYQPHALAIAVVAGHEADGTPLYACHGGENENR